MPEYTSMGVVMQKAAETVPKHASHVQFGAVLQDENLFTAEPRLKLPDAIQIHNCGAVNAQELFGIKYGL